MAAEGITIDSFSPLTAFDPAVIFYAVLNETDHQITGAQLLSLLAQNLTEAQLPPGVVTEQELVTALQGRVTSTQLTAILGDYQTHEAALASLQTLTTKQELKDATREFLTTQKTFYVRPDGSNTNTGEANTAQGAFLTIQAAIDKAASYDFGNNSAAGVLIQVADGTYNETLTLRPTINSQGSFTNEIWTRVKILGNSAAPGNVVLVGNGITAVGRDIVYVIDGFRFDLSAAPDWSAVIYATSGADVWFENIQVKSHQGCNIFRASKTGTKIGHGYTPFTIEGGGKVFASATQGAEIWFEPSSLTFVGTNNFSTSLVHCYNRSIIEWYPYNITGVVTGKRYFVGNNSIIDSNGVGANAVPGTIDGVVETLTDGIYF